MTPPAPEEPAAEKPRKGVEAEREPNFLFARFERRFLPWLAGRLPRWILPDDMTALGVLAASASAPRIKIRKTRQRA